jgi:tetratricopeptide (TPR) repeat protein
MNEKTPVFKRPATIATAAIAFCGITAITIFMFSARHNSQQTNLYQSPAPPIIYPNSEAVPENLSPTFALFDAPNAAKSLLPLPPSVFPPTPADVDQIASIAAQMALPIPNAITSARTGAPLPSKTGLFVCEPVVNGTNSASISNFGIGCGRWLHVVAAGQPELSRSPLWSDLERIKQELRRDNIQLSPNDARRLRPITGVTHIACGTITGSSANCTLTYQVYQLPFLNTVGPSVKQTGSFDQISENLPRIARSIDIDLGISSPQIPAASLTAEDLTTTGKLAFNPEPADPDLLLLSQFSAQNPVAALELLYSRAAKDQIVLDNTVRSLLKLAPTNAIAISAIAEHHCGALRSYAAADKALFGKDPYNGLLAYTEVWEQRLWGSRLEELSAAVRAAMDSPDNPDSWIVPAETLSLIAKDVRDSRLPDDFSGTEWTNLPPLYAKSESELRYATDLDPSYGHAWFELGIASSFNSDRDAAVIAFEQAEKLDPNSSEVDYQEIELYLPKWDNYPEALERAAQRSTARIYGNIDDAMNAVDDLGRASSDSGSVSYANMASWVLANTIMHQRMLAQKYPNDPFVHWDLARMLVFARDPNGMEEALTDYQIAAHFLPNSPALHSDFAYAFGQANNNKAKELELRRTIALDTYFPDAHYSLGDLLQSEGNLAAAVQELTIASEINSDDSFPFLDLGTIYRKEDKPALSAQNLNRVVQLDPYNAVAWEGLCADLDESGRYSDSLSAGYSALRADKLGKETNQQAVEGAHDALADVYLHMQDWNASLEQSNQALAINDVDATAHENKAAAYWSLGRADDARAEWKEVVSFKDPDASPVAAKLLAEHS